jgi:hypothetical protein
MDTSLAPFRQVLRKLCLFKPLHSWEPLPGHWCSRVMSRDSTPLKMPYEVFLSILESSRHELCIVHGFTFITLSLRGWEAFRTPGALTHTSITWAFSPPAPQVPGVNPGSPLCPWCFVHSLWRGARHSPPPNGVDALIDYTCSRHTNSRVAILYGVALCLP